MNEPTAPGPAPAGPEKDWQGVSLRIMNVRELIELWKVQALNGKGSLEIGSSDPPVEDIDDHFLNGFMTGMSLFNLREIASKRPIALLDFWAVFLPQRIVDEDLADYIEDINRRRALGEVWQPGARAWAAVFWTAVNAVGYVVSNLFGKHKVT